MISELGLQSGQNAANHYSLQPVMRCLWQTVALRFCCLDVDQQLGQEELDNKKMTDKHVKGNDP
eukprot:4308780-Amphidinium_carterae.1